MPTGSSTVGSPSPGSSKQASCNDDQSLIFSPHHLPNLKHNRLYLTSERPRPGPLNVVVPTVLVPQCRRQHEAQIVPDSRGSSPAMTTGEVVGLDPSSLRRDQIGRRDQHAEALAPDHDGGIVLETDAGRDRIALAALARA